MSSLKRTPLFEIYEKYGARLVDFGGWELPVQFSSINEEHLAVRERAGIFDVSHMGEIKVSGPGALAFLQKAATNDLERIGPGKAQYSALLNEKGGIIDDIFIYNLGHEYLLCVNAGNTAKDFAWLESLDRSDCQVVNESEKWAQIAIQGPRAVEIVSRAADRDLSVISRNNIAPLAIAGADTLVARTGYTGEDGLELFIPADKGIDVWEKIMAAGGGCGVAPCGLGARDTLRLEMGYPLHGHDITPETTPLEADLAWIVALYKPDFLGKNALEEQKRKGIKRKRVGLKMLESGIPRDGYKIVAPGGEGKVTSGTKTPCLDSPVAMGYVPVRDAVEGVEVEIEIRKKSRKAVVSPWPFYKGLKKTETVCEK